jgi:GntR family transcriptional regulator
VKLSVIHVPEERLRLFRLGKAVSAFRVQGLTFCGKEMILDMEDTIDRGEMYRFDVKATR